MNDEAVNSCPKVTLVAPIYNVEKYLRACVESVLAQTFTDFELILVDDGSPDKCGEICDELAKQDPRIRVFHQENGGVTSARRLGVEQARGEWICFVDPDDILPSTSLKDLFDEATDDTDWVQGQIQLFNDGGKPQISPLRKTVKTFNQVGIVENMMRFHRGPVAKIVRRKLFTPHVMGVPRDIRVGQDAQMNFRLIANNPRNPKEISSVVYFYRQQDSSSCHASILSEDYNFRYADLLLAELKRFPEADRKQVKVSTAHVFCSHAVSPIIHGIPIIASRELADLIRPGIGRSLKCFLVWACLRFNFLPIARFAAKAYRRFKGRKFEDRPKRLVD